MELAGFIDHTLLKPDTRGEDIKKLCEEALAYHFAAVCVPPFYVKDAVNQLDETRVKVSTVVGFPFGYSTTSAKVEEIKRALDEGANEVDVVVNIAAIKNGSWNYVQNDIASMTTAVHLKGKQVKIILETGLMNDEEVERLCEICREVEPDFVKTSTGYNGSGATVETVKRLHQLLEGSPIKIKASGGIRSLADAQAMIEAGASRIGSSSGVHIMEELT